MSSESTPKQRAAQVIRLLDDPVADLGAKESFNVIYTWIMYEFCYARETRYMKLRAKYGRRMSQVMEIANFKHQLQDL